MLIFLEGLIKAAPTDWKSRFKWE